MFESTALTGRNALICGASSGIGRAAALEIARMGARVGLLARNRSSLEDLAREIKAQGGLDPVIICADLSVRENLLKGIQVLLAEVSSIQILINNSGGPPPGPLLEASQDQLLAAFTQHVLASHLLVKLLLPGMREAGYGRIINVISTSVREPIPGLGVSNTIRGATASWAKTLAGELPPGVTINNILPGFTKTPRLEAIGANRALESGSTLEAIEAGWCSTIPEGRLADPQELGQVIAFLASPAAGYIRGVSLPVDGGRLKSI